MRKTLKPQPMLSLVFGAVLAFLSTWGLTQCVAMVSTQSKAEYYYAIHRECIARRDAR